MAYSETSEYKKDEYAGDFAHTVTMCTRKLLRKTRPSESNSPDWVSYTNHLYNVYKDYSSLPLSLPSEKQPESVRKITSMILENGILYSFADYTGRQVNTDNTSKTEPLSQESPPNNEHQPSDTNQRGVPK
ncbi:hypothetical protein AGMMS49992_18670 [Clostridia bacterium]|nr:hypothetical protein AGMMS49992_18670 [Clostridia bacterium]